MTEQQLTINEVLRFMHHDAMNQLQLVKMNLDLDRIEEAKKAIDQMAETSLKFFHINSLGVPKTSDWLHLVGWRYPSLEVEIESHITTACHSEWDETLVTLLEDVTAQICKQLDPLVEQRLFIHVFSNGSEFEIAYRYEGRTESEPLVLTLNDTSLIIEDVEMTNESWRFCIYAHKEGL